MKVDAAGLKPMPERRTEQDPVLVQRYTNRIQEDREAVARTHAEKLAATGQGAGSQGAPLPASGLDLLV